MKHYDPNRVQLVFSKIPISGFAEGTMVKVSKEEKVFTHVRGCDGEVTRSKKKGVVTMITCTLMQTSISNAVLSGIHIQDQLADGGAGVAEILLKDGNGASIVACAEAWIDGMPDGEYADKAGPREWTFVCIPNPATHIEGGT